MISQKTALSMITVMVNKVGVQTTRELLDAFRYIDGNKSFKDSVLYLWDLFNELKGTKRI